MKPDRIAQPLKVARAIADETSRELSAQSGVSEVTLSHIESGSVRPIVKTRKKIEEALGLPVDWDSTYNIGRMKRRGREYKTNNIVETQE